MQTATCNYSSLQGFNLPVSYLPGLPAATAAARECIETESKGRIDKGMGREGKEKVCVYMLSLAGEFHWRGA